MCVCCLYLYGTAGAAQDSISNCSCCSAAVLLHLERQRCRRATMNDLIRTAAAVLSSYRVVCRSCLVRIRSTINDQLTSIIRSTSYVCTWYTANVLCMIRSGIFYMQQTSVVYARDPKIHYYFCTAV